MFRTSAEYLELRHVMLNSRINLGYDEAFWRELEKTADRCSAPKQDYYMNPMSLIAMIQFHPYFTQELLTIVHRQPEILRYPSREKARLLYLWAEKLLAEPRRMLSYD